MVKIDNGIKRNTIQNRPWLVDLSVNYFISFKHVVFNKLPRQEVSTEDSMERVSSRPNSLPAIRQRVQPTVDTGFKTVSNFSEHCKALLFDDGIGTHSNSMY